MDSSEPMISGDAQEFLKRNGLPDLIPIIVEKHKFETVESLHLLAKNTDMIKMMDVPLCYFLQLKEILMNLPAAENKQQQKCSNNYNTGASTTKKEEDINAAMVVPPPEKINSFNSTLSRLVNKATKEDKWQGNGGLKVSAGTTFKQAQENCHLVADILSNKELASLYGTYPVDGHGVIELSSKRGKAFIGQKLSQARKPSGYKNTAEKRKRKGEGNKEVKESKRVKVNSSNSEKRDKETEVLVHVDVHVPAVSDEKEDDSKVAEPDEEVHKEQLRESDYEKKRNQRIHENNVGMINCGLHIQDVEEELEESLEAKIISYCDELERNGILKKIIKKACEVAQRLPKDLGRGGKAGRRLYKNLDKEVKECLDARIQAAERVSTVVDDVVDQKIDKIHNLTDSLYKGNDTCSLFDSNMSMRLFGHVKLFVSGSIIKQFQETHFM